jgi:rhamnogalacturonyl hydrolase YesR
MGMARVISAGHERYIEKGRELLDSMLKYQCADTGLFHNVLDDSTSFVEGCAAMMCAVFIYKGISGGWLERDRYLASAELVFDNVQENIDRYGIIRGVCGCPHFSTVGTSAEAQATYIMMEVARNAIG